MIDAAPHDPRRCREVRVHGGREVRPALPVREQVEVLAWPLKDSVRRDRVSAGQGEPEWPTGSQPNLGQAAVDRQRAVGHYAVDRRAATS